MATNDKNTIQDQAAEIERLRAEIENLKKAGEPIYLLPHTMRKGIGDAWMGYSPTRERPDNVPKVGKAPSTGGPSNADVVEYMAAQAIAEAAKGK